MSEKSVCRKCKYFNGFDGVGELWTGCHFGDFKGIKTSCNNFEKKITKADLLRRVSELEKENEQLRKSRDKWRELSNSFSAYCNCYEKAIDRAYEEKLHPTFEDIYNIYSKLEKELFDE